MPNFKTITDEMCCQGGIRRIVLTEKIAANIGEGVSFTIPTGPIGTGDRLKLFMGFEHVCPSEMAVCVNGKACSSPDFGMDSYAFLKDPTLKPHTIAAYSLNLENADAAAQTVTVTGNPTGIITYLELKVETI